MVTFIDIIDKSCNVGEDTPRQVSLSISDKTTPPTMTMLGGLSHASVIEFDKVNAQKMIDFLQKNVIGIEDPKFQKKDRVTPAGNTTTICGTIESIGVRKQGEKAEMYVVWDELLQIDYGPSLNMGWYGEDEIVKVE